MLSLFNGLEDMGIVPLYLRYFDMGAFTPRQLEWGQRLNGA